MEGGTIHRRQTASRVREPKTMTFQSFIANHLETRMSKMSRDTHIHIYSPTSRPILILPFLFISHRTPPRPPGIVGYSQVLQVYKRV